MTGHDFLGIGLCFAIGGLDVFIIAGLLRLSGINPFEFWLGISGQLMIGAGLTVMILSKKERGTSDQ